MVKQLEPRSRTRPKPSMAILIMLAGVGAMAMNVFLPSLPGMTTYFETTPAKVQLSISLFLAFNAVFQLIIGPLSDRFGRRPVLLISLLIFCIATLASIFATTIEFFLFCRVFQAAVVAGMILSRTAVRDMYDTREAASVIGYVTMGMALVPMIAPSVGGFLDSAFGWQGGFWALFLFGSFVLFLTYIGFGETNEHQTQSVTAQFHAYPELFGARRFWAYVIAASTASGAFFAYLGGAPFVGAQVFDLPVDRVGLFLSTPAIGYALGNFISGRFSVRFGINMMILWGTILAVLGLGLNLFLFAVANPGPWVFFGLIIAMGLGNGMCLPNAMTGMMSVRPHLAGSASGIGGAIMTAGGALLSLLAAAVIDIENGAVSLLLIMTICSAIPLLAVGYILRREQTHPDLQS